MSQILCSTGALIGRPNGRNYRLLSSLKNQIDCDGFELMIYSSWYPEWQELVSFIESQHLNIPVLHCEKMIGEYITNLDEEAYRYFELNCAAAQRLGAEKLVLHLWNGIISDKHIGNNIAAVERLLEIAEKYQQRLMIENVVCNQQDPMTHWLTLAEKYPELSFIFDTKMADFHRQIDELYTHPELHRRIHHYHVNDYGGDYMDWQNLRVLPIGEGHIDFDRFFAYIKSIGYDGSFTLESTAFDRQTGTVDPDMLNRQIAYIREKLK